MKSKQAEKEKFDAAIRRAVEANGGKRVTLQRFQMSSALGKRVLYRHYASWEEALRGAGFTFPRYHQRTPPEALLEQWGKVARKIGHPPTMSEYTANSTIGNGTTFRNKFGSWLGMPQAFCRFAHGREEWADVVAITAGFSRKTSGAVSCLVPASEAETTRTVVPLHGRPIYGDQLDFPSMRHGPSNELGVVYLFALMAERLGFAVERMQTTFPDCQAKRQVHGGKWQQVAIEFEYESRNFLTHGHDAAGCDIIVCWVHNWPDCPKNLEVIALREEIKRFAECKTTAVIDR